MQQRSSSLIPESQRGSVHSQVSDFTVLIVAPNIHRIRISLSRSSGIHIFISHDVMGDFQGGNCQNGSGDDFWNSVT